MLLILKVETLNYSQFLSTSPKSRFAQDVWWCVGYHGFVLFRTRLGPNDRPRCKWAGTKIIASISLVLQLSSHAGCVLHVLITGWKLVVRWTTQCLVFCPQISPVSVPEWHDNAAWTRDRLTTNRGFLIITRDSLWIAKFLYFFQVNFKSEFLHGKSYDTQMRMCVMWHLGVRGYTI